ncbi:MAG: transcriptional repressor [Verrucomicrobiota bacterium]
MTEGDPSPSENEAISEAWSSHLRAQGQRLTTPRRVVLQASQRVSSPFSAEDLLDEARKIDGLISLPTIYRNLPLLIGAGILRKIVRDDPTQLYANDPPGSVEMKLVCRKTKEEKVIHDDCLRLRMLLLARQNNFRVERIEVRIEGVAEP